MSNLILGSIPYYSWIPTNIGKLSFSLIGKNPLIIDLMKVDIANKSLIIDNIDLSFISDTRSILKETDKNYLFLLPHFYLENEVELIGRANIKLKYNSNKETYEGKLEVFYDDLIGMSAKYIIKQNGVLKIYDIEYAKYLQYYSNTGSVSDGDIAQVLYVILKLIVHGDAHHHQKVDTLIQVMPNKFECNKIIDNFIDYFKRKQIDLKNATSDMKCKNMLKLYNIPLETKGVNSYIKTFQNLFCKDEEQKREIFENLQESLESKTNTTSNKQTFENTTTGYTFIMAGIIVSLNIFMVNIFNFKHSIELSTEHYLLINILLIAVLIKLVAYKQLYCRYVSSYFYNHYASYEYFKFLSALPEEEVKNLNWKDRCIRYCKSKKQAFLFVLLSIGMVYLL